MFDLVSFTSHYLIPLSIYLTKSNVFIIDKDKEKKKKKREKR